jgi:Transposase DDE domain
VSIYTPPGFRATLRSFLDADGLPFNAALSEGLVERIAAEERVDFADGPDAVYSPAVTLWAWLSQCLSASKSCVGAVARVLVLRVGLGLPPCSAATGAYCKARAKLEEPFLRRLAIHVGVETEDKAPDAWRWHGKRVLLVDGTECSMPDTPENQAEYPQPGTQRRGLGFPLIRLVVLLTFATACLADCVMGPRKGKGAGETSLFKQMLGSLREGDVLVADRYYCAYWLVVAARGRGADVCFRLHSQRHADFRRGRRLGKDDHVVSWPKPKRPAWMGRAEYDALPESLEMREARFQTGRPGYRTREVVVATTLLDAVAHPKDAVAELYGRRWQVELDIRGIKQTLKMDVLSCKTPGMARKEIWTHLLAYNLTREVMARAAAGGEGGPRGLSLAGAAQTLDAFRWLLLLGDEGRQGAFAQALLAAVRTHRVGRRPGRVEPRKVKRRPKAQRLLTRTRAEERARLTRGLKD